MTNKNKSFLPDAGLEHAIDLLRQALKVQENLPDGFPNLGIGELETLDLLAPHVLGRAARLDNPKALAHMDPPTPWITWATTLWNARLNQNLLHPATAPFAIEAEKKVIDWLTPFYGMNGGHICSGSTIANLTALWAARDAKGIEKIVASKAAHISIEKAARILGLPYEQIATNSEGQIDPDKIGDISNACLVLTAGTTATGVIDPLALAGQAKWTHRVSETEGTIDNVLTGFTITPAKSPDPGNTKAIYKDVLSLDITLNEERFEFPNEAVMELEVHEELPDFIDPTTSETVQDLMGQFGFTNEDFDINGLDEDCFMNAPLQEKDSVETELEMA